MCGDPGTWPSISKCDFPFHSPLASPAGPCSWQCAKAWPRQMNLILVNTMLTLIGAMVLMGGPRLHIWEVTDPQSAIPVLSKGKTKWVFQC